MRAHLYGTSPYIPLAPFLNSEGLLKVTGGNSGNLMFCHGAVSMLDIAPDSIPWHANTDHLNSSKDILVMPLANQLGPHTDMGNLANFMQRSDIPILALGLGAQGPLAGYEKDKIPEGSWLWLKAIVKRATNPNKPNISLRGDRTHALIKEMGFEANCVVTGCPSNFISPSANLGIEIKARLDNYKPENIVVAAGNPFIANLNKLELSLTDILKKSSRGLYVCQHPIDLIRLSKGEYSSITDENFSRFKSYILGDCEDDNFQKWFKSYSHVFTSVPEWISYVKHFDLVLGTRIHGVMAGIQAGVPSLCLCIDSRTLELCETMHIPHIIAKDYSNGITVEIVQDILANWDWVKYDSTRKILASRFIELFEDNKLKSSNTLLKILNS